MPTEATTTPDAVALLRALRHGDTTAIERLVPLVQQEVRAIVGRLLVDGDASAPRQAAAIVQEAWVRLVASRQPARSRQPLDDRDRAGFFAIGATFVRRTLVDHARARRATKRGEPLRLTLDGSLARSGERSMDLVALDRALIRLSELDLEQSRVTELRFFGGLDTAAVAQVLEMPPRAVDDAWLMARAWIRREIGKFDTP